MSPAWTGPRGTQHHSQLPAPGTAKLEGSFTPLSWHPNRSFRDFKITRALFLFPLLGQSFQVYFLLPRQSFLLRTTTGSFCELPAHLLLFLSTAFLCTGVDGEGKKRMNRKEEEWKEVRHTPSVTPWLQPVGEAASGESQVALSNNSNHFSTTTYPFSSEIACETSVPHPCNELSFQSFKYTTALWMKNLYFS